MTALMELMTQCGISADQLAEIGTSMTTTTGAATDDSSTTVAASVPGDLDAAAASAVLALLGLDETAVTCLVDGAVGAPLDDAAAEQVFIGCGVGPAQVLDAIVVLNALALDAPVDTGGEPATTPPVTSGNAMVDLLLEQLATQGINLDATQGQCLLDNISDLDPNDMSAMVAVFETCGIDIADLLPSG